MRWLVSHLMRVISKYWFIILIAGSISAFIGLGLLIVMTIVSMVFFDNHVDEKKSEDYFTEEEMRLIQNDEAVDDESYLNLLAKYQTYECPKKVDEITTWTSSELTKDSFICHYEINDKWRKYGEIDMDIVKNNILGSIDKQGYKVQRIVATNRNIIFRYWNRQTETLQDVVLSTEELKS